MSEKIKDFIDKLNGDNAGAGEVFKDALRDKVADSLDAQRQDIAEKYLMEYNQKHIATLNRGNRTSERTDQVIDTTGQEIKFTPNTETPTAEHHN